MITLVVFLFIICISLIIIAWDNSRKEAVIQHSRYLEFDPTELERQNAFNSHHRLAKKTLTYYGLGIFCQYVTFFSALLI
jgi:hypothetical protein